MSEEKRSREGAGRALERRRSDSPREPSSAPRSGGSRGDGHPREAGDGRSAPGPDGDATARRAEEDLARLVRELLPHLGEDPDRPGLARTPARVAESLRWLTRGYRMRVEEAIGDAIFDESHDSMVLVKDIEIYSLCEHHLLPFFGKAHVAYIPDGRIIGLSKVPRIVEVFARRLQVQERLTEEIAVALEDVLAPKGVGVVVEAYHLCMMMRGVEKQNSKTITSAVRGTFRKDPRTREEFLRLALAPQFIS